MIYSYLSIEERVGCEWRAIEWSRHRICALQTGTWRDNERVSYLSPFQAGRTQSLLILLIYLSSLVALFSFDSAVCGCFYGGPPIFAFWTGAAVSKQILARRSWIISPVDERVGVVDSATLSRTRQCCPPAAIEILPHASRCLEMLRVALGFLEHLIQLLGKLTLRRGRGRGKKKKKRERRGGGERGVRSLLLIVDDCWVI